MLDQQISNISNSTFRIIPQFHGTGNYLYKALTIITGVLLFIQCTFIKFSGIQNGSKLIKMLSCSWSFLFTHVGLSFNDHNQFRACLTGTWCYRWNCLLFNTGMKNKAASDSTLSALQMCDVIFDNIFDLSTAQVEFS